jgi:hypothetical protein
MNYVDIDTILDDRGKRMHVGSKIVYSPILAVEDLDRTRIIIKGSKLKVEKLERVPNTGFAQVVDSTRLITESGEVFSGEWLGWEILSFGGVTFI